MCVTGAYIQDPWSHERIAIIVVNVKFDVAEITASERGSQIVFDKIPFSPWIVYLALPGHVVATCWLVLKAN